MDARPQLRIDRRRLHDLQRGGGRAIVGNLLHDATQHGNAVGISDDEQSSLTSVVFDPESVGIRA